MTKIVAITFFLLFFLSCTTTKYVPVENVKTVYLSNNQVDSVILHDSIFQKIHIKGDTVFSDKFIYKNLYIKQFKIDTVIKTDTISKPYPVEKIKEVRKKDWLYYAGNTALVFFVGFFGYKGIKKRLTGK
jgi:hypothetical protein